MVILATKLYVEGEARERSLDGLASMVRDDIGQLDVEFELGIRRDDFPSVTVTGPDATVARNVLTERWGAIPGRLESGESYIGTLASWTDEGWTLDAGRSVQIPCSELGLGPGRGGQLRDRFGVLQHQRLEFVWGETPALSEAERDRLFEWRRGPGRLNVNSVTRAEVRRVLNKAGHADDVIRIERLGLLEQSVVCAPGTDPPGLLSSVGPYLPGEMRCVLTDPTND